MKRRRLWITAAAGLAGVVVAYFLGVGTVIDEMTGKPIEGVYVVARWTARQITQIESSDACFKVVSTKTDSSGRFMLWPISWNIDPRLWFRERELLFYKRQYRLSKTEASEFFTIFMRRDTSAAEDRHESMMKVA